MTDHADTIRRALKWARNSGLSVNGNEALAALDALLAKLRQAQEERDRERLLRDKYANERDKAEAERQQAIDEAEKVKREAFQRALEITHGPLTKEEQEAAIAALGSYERELREVQAERQQAIDALREIASKTAEPPTAFGVKELSQTHHIARAALVNLGEKE